MGIFDGLGDNGGSNGGLLGMLGDPTMQANIAMILKGLSPYSNLDPQQMMAQAQRLKLLQEERALDAQRRREDIDIRERHRQEEMDWRKTEADRAQRNTEATNTRLGLTDLSRDIINETGHEPGTPEYRAEYQRRKQLELQKGYTKVDIENPDGSKSTMFQDKFGNFKQPHEVIPGYTAPSPTNPYASGAKMTENEGKAGTFADRMVESHKTINEFEKINEGMMGALGGAAARTNIPGVGPVRDTSIFNAVASPERQRILQAQRNFLNAVLRKESGATITPSEFENGSNQYFPQPGDSEAVIEQKRDNRRIATEGLMREAGRGYRPPEGWGGKGSQKSDRKPTITREQAIEELRRRGKL